MTIDTKKTVKDLTTAPIISIESSETLVQAGKKMKEKEVSMLVVMEKDQVVGLLTSGDWFKSFYLHVGAHLPETKFRTNKAGQFELQKQKMEIVKKRAAEFKQMKVSTIMNRHFTAIDEDASLIEAIHQMKASDIRRLLVADKTGKIIGVLGRTRTINTLLEE